MAKSEAEGESPARPERGAGADIDFGLLDQRLGYILRRAQVAIFADFIAGCSHYDIRPVQYSILTIIEHNPGLFQTQVAEALGIKKTNFVAMIAALEKRGLVRREPLAHDRRSYGLYLTETGGALMPELHALAQAHEDRIVEKVGADMHAALFRPMRQISSL